MPNDLNTLLLAALSIGFFHTLAGPDHYLPFVAMSQAGSWSLRKTMVITLLCGIGHVLGSVLLGVLGIALGILVFKLEHIEAIRGDLAGWLLLTFGLLYFGWGLAQGMRGRSHLHFHAHADGTVHAHDASPTTATAQKCVDIPHRGGSMTPWVLFTVFLFGPCEPLIPMLMYPAALGDAGGVVGVTLLFGTSTIATMLVVVLALVLSAGRLQGILRRPRLAWLPRYSHALAGLVVFGCGVAITCGF